MNFSFRIQQSGGMFEMEGPHSDDLYKWVSINKYLKSVREVLISENMFTHNTFHLSHMILMVLKIFFR